MTIGKITHNSVGKYFWEVYPGLQSGILSFNFTHDKTGYVLEVFYNLMAKSLFYNIKTQSGTIMQSQMNLASYPTNLLVNMDFRGGYLYYKDDELVYESL